MAANMNWFIEFIKRKENFHGENINIPEGFNSEKDCFLFKIHEVEECAKKLFKNIQNSEEEDIAKSKFACILNKEGMLIFIIKSIYDIIIESNDCFRFFRQNSFFEICPNLLDDEYYKKSSFTPDIDPQLNSLLYIHMVNACVFTTLCFFIHTSNRKSGHSIQKALEENYRPVKKFGSEFEPIIDDSEKVNIRKMKQRLSSRRGSYNKNSAWSAISMDSGYELAIIYELRFYDFLKKEFNGRKLVDEKLARVYKRIGNLFTDLEKAFSQPSDNYSKDILRDAIKRFSSKVKKIKYADYLELNKYILGKIVKEKKYYGINLYRIEKKLRPYGTINEVDLLLHCTDKAKENIILENIFYLKDIHFPHLYRCFNHIEKPANLLECLKAFSAIRENVVSISCLVIDKLVEDGCFGDGDKWYYLFLKLTNDMAEEVFYDPTKIDYLITPESQAKFEQVLSAPLHCLGKYAE